MHVPAIACCQKASIGFAAAIPTRMPRRVRCARRFRAGRISLGAGYWPVLRRAARLSEALPHTARGRGCRTPIFGARGHFAPPAMSRDRPCTPRMLCNGRRLERRRWRGVCRFGTTTAWLNAAPRRGDDRAG
eukprot:2137014-Prymnesium_polylepis.4